MSKLVIVESPHKATMIKKYLGKSYDVTASVGHIRDLPAAKLSVDIKNDFAPKYAIVKGKEKLVKELKEKDEIHEKHEHAQQDKHMLGARIFRKRRHCRREREHRRKISRRAQKPCCAHRHHKICDKIRCVRCAYPFRGKYHRCERQKLRQKVRQPQSPKKRRRI